MSDLQELYQSLVIDHGRQPRNFYVMEAATHQREGFNPLCGDRFTVYLRVVDGLVKEASFSGQGCAISTASASLMTAALIDLTMPEVENLFQKFHDALCEDKHPDIESLGKLVALAGVKQYPMRVKCATLAWHAMRSAISSDLPNSVSTE